MQLKNIKKVFRAFFFIIILVCYSSCHRTKENTENISYLKADMIKVDNDLIADISLIYIDSTRIFARHRKSSPLLIGFNISGDTIIKNLEKIEIGNGPNEVHSLLLNSNIPSKDLLKFYDPTLKKLLVYNIKCDSLYEDDSFNTIKRDITIFRLAEGLEEGTLVSFLSTSNSDENIIIGLISKSDSLLHNIEGVGGDFMRDMNLSKKMYYAPNSTILVQPDGKNCLFIPKTGQYAEIFKIDGNHATDKRILINNIPEFTIDNRGRLDKAPGDLKFGFQSDVSHDRIYIAPYRFTNSELEEGLKNNPDYNGPGKGPDFSDQLYEYDWDGNLLNKYNLSHPLSGFKVAPDGRIWGISEDNDYNQIIVRYDLSSYNLINEK